MNIFFNFFDFTTLLLITLVFFNVLLITSKNNLILVLGVFLTQVIFVTLLFLSQGQEVIPYSFLIIYGGGIMVIYLIVIMLSQFNGAEFYNPNASVLNYFVISLSSFVALAVVCCLNFTLFKQNFSGNEAILHNFTREPTQNYAYTFLLNGAFLGTHSGSLVGIGFLLFSTIYIIVSIMKK